MAISFQKQHIQFSVTKSSQLKTWIKKVVEREKKGIGQVNFVFMNDEHLLTNNIRFLGHHSYTDIITFDYCENDLISGDILISIDRVRENAAKFKVQPDMELRRVMIHGVLHLCGYGDKSPKQRAQMRKKEDAALKLF